MPNGKVARFEVAEGTTPEQAEKFALEQFNSGMLQDEPVPVGAGQMSAMGLAPGRPIPTGEEEAAAGINFLKFAAPIAGDVALTPFGGSLARKAFQGSKFVAPLLGRMAGSATGSAGGSAAADLLLGKDVDVPRAGREALYGAGGELGATAIGKAAKPISEWVGKKVFRPLFSATADLTISGSKMKDWWFDKFQREVTKRSDNFLKEMVPESYTKGSRGVEIGRVLDTKKDWSRVYGEANEMIKAAGEPKTGMLTDWDKAQEMFRNRVSSIIDEYEIAGKYKKARSRTSLSIQDALDEIGITDAKARARMEDIYKGYPLTPEETNYLLKHIWNEKTFSSLSKEKVEWITKFKTAYVDDIKRMGGAKLADYDKVLGAADKVYAETNRWFRENPNAKIITGDLKIAPGTKYYEYAPEKVIDRLIGAQPDEIARIREAVLDIDGGDAAWAGFKMHFIDGIYKEAQKKVDDIGGWVLQPDDLFNSIYGREAQIKAVSPDLWPKLKAEADAAKITAEKMKLAQTPKQPLLRGTGAAVGGFLGSTTGIGAPIGAGIAEGIGTISAWSLLSDAEKNILKKFVKGIPKATTKGGIHLGGQRVFEDQGGTP